MNPPDQHDGLADWLRLSQQERDRAYNNNEAVADSAALNEERIAAAAAYRALPGAILDVPYGPAERMRWDLFPAKTPQAPCLVFIHGGYWQRNRREDFACLAAGVVAHGWSAALPGYTLAPAKPLSGIAEEIDRALDFLAAHGPQHGIKGPLIISGWSAGGHLAALGLAHPAVTAGIAISGVYDLAPLRHTYLNEKLNLSDAEIATLSPLRLPPVQKPLAIAYGTDELPRLVADSQALHRYRAEAGAPGPLIALQGANHFTILDALRRADGEITQAALTLAKGE